MKDQKPEQVSFVYDKKNAYLKIHKCNSYDVLTAAALFVREAAKALKTTEEKVLETIQFGLEFSKEEKMEINK